ncbi:MAG: hypothetical protein Q4B94_01735 [Pseudomonadota bacterium]|nr:hypothetical protein [Pseudomonadota bacterium]
MHNNTRAFSSAHAANDAGSRHDLFTLYKQVGSIARLSVPQLAWLVAELQHRPFSQLTVAELLALIERTRTLPHVLPGGVQ